VSPDRPGRLYRWRFVGLCLSVFLLYVSYQLLLAVLPLHALALGLSEAQLGLIPGIFALSAMLLRPLAGHLADSIGRWPLVLLGPAIFALSSLGYGLVAGVAGLLALRLFHGVGMGFGPTAASVVVADVAPVERRGEAMAVFGLTTTTGLAAAPYVGIEISERWGAHWTFVTSAAVATVALLLALSLPETRPAGARPQGQLSPAAFFSRGALYPSALLLSLLFTYGGIITFLPLFAQRRGLGNPGLFFAVFAVVVLVTRTRSGSLADRFGRRLVLVPALVITGASLAVLAAAGSRPGLMAAAALYGVGFGAGQPALMAMTADRVAPAERGRALGTFFTAFELGILGGAMLLGPVATGLGYTAMWWVAAGVAWLGALGAVPNITRRRG
jgi:MFS family permease